MPSDVTGQLILDGGATAGPAGSASGPGPVFTNVLLADEINRTPPKTQAALLESMEERQVTRRGRDPPAARPVHRDRHPEPGRVRGHLPAARGAARPLPVQAGGGLPERRAGAGGAGPPRPGPRPARHGGRRHPPGGRPRPTSPRPAPRSRTSASTRRCSRYIVALARATRTAPAVTLGVSPRGAAMLLHAAKAWAWLAGRPFVTPDEVKAVVKPCLRHRIAAAARARARGRHGRRRARRHPRRHAGAPLTMAAAAARAVRRRGVVPTRRLAGGGRAGVGGAARRARRRGAGRAAWWSTACCWRSSPLARRPRWPRRPGRCPIERTLPGAVTLGADGRDRRGPCATPAAGRCAWRWPTSWRRRCGPTPAGRPRRIPAGRDVAGRHRDPPRPPRPVHARPSWSCGSTGRSGLGARQAALAVPGVLRVYPSFRSKDEAELRIRKARILEVGLRSAQGPRRRHRVRPAPRVHGRRRVPPDRLGGHRPGRARRSCATYRAERNQTVLVLLDNGRVMAGRVDGVPRVEHAMDAVMMLTAVATGPRRPLRGGGVRPRGAGRGAPGRAAGPSSAG